MRQQAHFPDNGFMNHEAVCQLESDLFKNRLNKQTMNWSIEGMKIQPSLMQTDGFFQRSLFSKSVGNGIV